MRVLPAVLLLLPTLAFAQTDLSQWKQVTGDWRVAEGVIEQTDPSRLASAIQRDPAYGDGRVTVEFNIAATGKGVRAAAVILHATGTLTHYWLHLDSNNHQLILTRRTPTNPWIEIARRGCAALTEGVWHTVVVDTKGKKITVALDGTEVLSAEDANLPAGRVGLGTSQGAVAFRNLKIEGETVPMEPLKDEQPPFQVISVGEASGPYQAFPDACRMQSGDIIVCFYAGYGHVSLPTAEWPKGGRICTARSSDEGRTWSKPTVLFDDELDNRDPHIAQLADGTLICTYFSYWKVGEATRYQTLAVRSTDGGATWGTKGQPVTPEMWAESAPVREMPNGTLLLGVYAEGANGSFGGVVRSTDHGKTWSEPIPIGKEANLPLDAETDVILLKDGTLYAALRSSSINMHYATSPDLGLTWSAVKDIGFKAHSPHFTRLSTGEIIMTHRLPATAMHVSRDECRTWAGPYQIDSVGGAYPATVELKDKTVLAIYYEEGEGSAIRALRFRLTAAGIEPLPW